MTDPPAVAPQRVWKARTDPATPHDVGHARP